jgi:virginiamycin B lyase
MAFHRAMSVAMLLALVSVTTTVGGEETTREARVEATIPQPGFVMATGFDSVWMMNLATDKLIRINSSDNSVTEFSIPGVVGRFARAGLAVGEGAVWLPDHGRSMIYKIDPVANRVAMEIPAGPFSGNGRQDRSWDKLTVGEGSVWAIISDNVLRRYSATDGTPEAAVSLPSRSSGVLVAFGSVWVTGTENDELYRVDPKTNQIASTIGLHSDPRSLVAGEGSVWINNEGDGTVQRIDGKSGDVVATIDTGAIGKGSIAVGGGFVWVSTHNEPIIQIDPRTNSVHGKFKLEMSEYSTLRFGSGSLWVSGGAVRRIKPPE